MYLYGGVYADVDVEPKPGLLPLIRRAREQDAVLLFDETSILDLPLLRNLAIAATAYEQIPAYASCIVVAPRPRAPFYFGFVTSGRRRQVAERGGTETNVHDGRACPFDKVRNGTL